jgi:predicted MFS family arabinose efflux permease
LIVPLLLALLAGTPVAIWLSAHIGWIYGTLTVISVVTLLVGFRWLGQKHEVKGSDEKSRQPIQLTMLDLENS